MADIVHEELRDGQTMGLYRDYVRAMYVMFKSAFLYETNNDALRSACERVSSIANKMHDQLDDVAALELLPEGAYVNRVLIKLDTGLYDQTEYLLAIYDRPPEAPTPMAAPARSPSDLAVSFKPKGPSRG